MEPSFFSLKPYLFYTPSLLSQQERYLVFFFLSVVPRLSLREFRLNLLLLSILNCISRLFVIILLSKQLLLLHQS